MSVLSVTWAIENCVLFLIRCRAQSEFGQICSHRLHYSLSLSFLGYSRNQAAPMSPRSYSAYTNAYGPSASTYGVGSPGFLNGEWRFIGMLMLSHVLACLYVWMSVCVCVANRQNGLSLVCHSTLKHHYQQQQQQQHQQQQHDSAFKPPLSISPIHQQATIANWNNLFTNSNSSSSTCSSMYTTVPTFCFPFSFRLHALAVLVTTKYSPLSSIFLGMTNLMSSAFSTIGPFGSLSSASAAAASSALNPANVVTPYGHTSTNKWHCISIHFVSSSLHIYIYFLSSVVFAYI